MLAWLCAVSNEMRKKETAAKKIPSPPGLEASAEELSAYFEKYGLEELESVGYVSELTNAEQEEMDLLSAECQSRINARKSRVQLNLAMSKEQLERFTRYANKKHIPPSTLAKAWILERLDQEAGEEKTSR